MKKVKRGISIFLCVAMLLALLSAGSAAAGADNNFTYRAGDVNNDRWVDVSDVVLLRGCIMEKPSDARLLARCDVNFDSSIDICDIIFLRNMITDLNRPQLDPEMIPEMREAMKAFALENYNGFEYPDEIALYKAYFGKFNDCDVILSWYIGAPDGSRDFTFDGFSIWAQWWYDILIYKDGCFYTLREAYMDMGIISKRDVLTIGSMSPLKLYIGDVFKYYPPVYH